MNFFGSVFSGVRRRNRREDRRRSGEEREEEEMEEEEEEKESGTKPATTPGDTQIHHERKGPHPTASQGTLWSPSGHLCDWPLPCATSLPLSSQGLGIPNKEQINNPRVGKTNQIRQRRGEPL